MLFPAAPKSLFGKARSSRQTHAPMMPNFQLDALESRVLLSAAPRIDLHILTPTSTVGNVSLTTPAGYVTGDGQASYQFTVAAGNDGWYELWAPAANWPTNLSLDGTLIFHGQLDAAAWTAKEGATKVMNLNLSAGVHTLMFDRSWFPGLPYLTKGFLDPASALYTNGDLAGSTHIAWPADNVAFAQNQAVTVTVSSTNYGTVAEPLRVQIINDVTSAVVATTNLSVLADGLVHTYQVTLPTAAEGVYDVVTTDTNTLHAAERTEQYTVVSAAVAAPVAPPPSAVLNGLYETQVLKIDPNNTTQAPTYSSGNLNYVASSSVGAYLESGPAGHAEAATGADGDWFAYTLSGLTVGKAYEIQIDYPDNAQRTFAISLEQGATNPSEAGVAGGGPYRLSNAIQSQSIVFWATRSDPRLLFMNWHSGQRAAVQEIRVNSIDTPTGYTTPFPALNGTNPTNRTNSLYFEQYGSIPGYMGGSSAVDDWNEWLTSVDRLGQWSRYEGINQWIESVDSYGNSMAPNAALYGYSPADEAGTNNGLYNFGIASAKDFYQKDLIRLELLKAQEYGLSYIPELQPGIDGDAALHLDTLFGGDGNPGNNVYGKSWVAVNNTGGYSKDGNNNGGPSPWAPYYNVFDSHVQSWVTALVSQMATRYADSPALTGVAIRLMTWQFSGMFSVASLNWGYEDSTINMFRAANPTLNMPDYIGATRFADRYAWLVTNDATNHAKQTWINWRSAQITAFYQSLTTMLQAIPRPNGGAPLKLIIDAFGSNYDTAAGDRGGYRAAFTSQYDTQGYAQVAKESGINLAALAAIPGLTFINNTSYPAGIRWPNGNPYLAQAAYDIARDPAAIQQSATTAPGGTVAQVKFGNEYFEDNFLGNIGWSTQTYNTLWMAAAANPAGVNYLARYAAALAAGNITQIGDGGLGYNIGQPVYLRPFMAEYMSLPSIGMTELATATDPVALWYGANTQNNHLDFYLVNQADYAVTVTVTLPGTPSVYRLSSGAAVATSNGLFTITLQPYQLLAYENRASTAAPTGFVATPQDSTVAAQLSQQLSFVQNLINDSGGASATGYAQFVLAQTDFAAGKYWGARQALMSHQLVSLYESYGAYPANLFVGIAPQTPLKPTYELTFDAMAAGNAAGPYNNAMAPYDIVPPTNNGGVIGQVPVTRLDGTLGGLPSIPQIVASNGPQGGMALSLTTPDWNTNVGYHVASSVTGTNLIGDPAGLTIEMDVNLSSYTNTGLPMGGMGQWGTGGISPSFFFYGGTTNNPGIEFGISQNATFENIFYTPSTSIVGAWHHIAGVYVDKAGNGQSRLELWIDSVKVSSLSYAEDPATQVLVQTGWDFGVNASEVANGRVVSGLYDAFAVTAKPLFPGNFIISNLLAAPTSLSAAPVSANQVNLTWNVPSGTVSGYNIYRATTPGGENYAAPINGATLVNGITYADTTASGGTTYYYTIKAVNAAGSSVASTEAGTLTYPAAPTALTTSPVSTTQINLNWTAPAGTVTGYNIYRATTPGGESGTPLNTTLLTTTTYNDTTGAAGTTYYYTAKAVNATGSSVAAAEANAPTYPAAPAPVYELTFDAMPAGNATGPYNNAMAPYDVVPSTNNGGVIGQVPVTRLDGNGGTLIPQIVPSNGPQGGMALSLSVPTSGNVGYLVSRNVTGTNLIWDPAGLTIEMDVNLSSYTNSGLPVGGVSQWGAGGMEPGLFFYSGTTNNPSIYFGMNQAGATLIYAPTTSIVGAWHHIAGVYVDKAGNGQSRLEMWIDGVEVSTLNYAEAPTSQVLVQTGWSFGVNGPEIANGRVVSGLMDAASITAAPLFASNFLLNHLTTPTAPTGLGATPVSASQVNLAWTASLGTVAGYNIYRGITPGGENYAAPLNGTTLVTTTAYNDTTASGGTTYYYTVKAVNTAGSSVASTEASALTYPAAPVGLSAAPILTNQVNLGWTAPAGTVTGYNIYRGTTPGSENYAAPLNGGTLVTGAAYSDTTASAGTTYYYTIKAVNTTGGSVISTEANTTTLSNAALPTSLTAYWRLDEGNGTIANDTSTGGTVVDTATLYGTPTWVTGKIGSALQLNGTTQYLQVANSADVNITGTALSVALWAKSGATNWNSTQTFLSKGSGIKFGGVSGTKNLKVSLYISGAWLDFTYTNTADISTNWRHYAVTYDGANVRFYVDGVNVSTQASTGSVATNTNALYIGRRGSAYLNGSIDEVRVYNSVQSAANITALYNQPALTVTGLTVNSPNSAAYSIQVNALSTGVNQYGDNSATFTTVPGKYLGSTFIRTANADAASIGSNLFTFTVNQPVTIYILRNSSYTTTPSWMTTAGFTATGDSIVSTQGTYTVFQKTVTASTITLGGNTADGLGTYGMYGILIVPVL